MLLILLYFSFTIVVNGLIPSLELEHNRKTEPAFSNSYSPRREVLQQLFDLALTISIQWVYRPRQWPEFFTIVGIIDEQESQDIPFGETQTLDQLVEKYRVVPFYTTTIDKNLLYSSKGYNSDYDDAEYRYKSLNSSFHSNEQVLILNPCETSFASDCSAKEASMICDTTPFIQPTETTMESDEVPKNEYVTLATDIQKQISAAN